MSSLPNIVRPCINEAVARSARLVERCMEHAGAALEDSLRRSASNAERRDLADAGRELARLRVSWVARFPQALRAALEAPPAKASRNPSRGTLRPSSLTLVDDSELTRSIEAARLAQDIAPKLEQPLAELDALMSPALGLDGVHPDVNPLRPEVFTQTLREVMGESDPPPGWPALWMRHMAKPLAEDLAHLYRAASKLLRQAGVESASYRVVTGHSPLAPAPAPAAREADSGRSAWPSTLTPRSSQFGDSRPPGGFGDSRPPGGSGPVPFMGSGGRHWSLGTLLHMAKQALRGPLFRDFLSRGAASQVPVQQRLEPAYYAQVDQELAALEARWDEAPYDPGAAQRHAHLPPVDRPMRPVGTDSPLDREVWGDYGAPRRRSLLRATLKKQAEHVGQVVGVEVVRQLVDQVAQDPRLLAPVREAIVALEPSLARLAMQSPQFFGEQDHPARQLVERVAERSFKYNDEFGSQFQEFFDTVSSTFNALNRLEQLEDARPFEQALQRLEAGWQAQDREEEAQRQQVLEAVRFAERRQAESEQIAWELSQRTDLEGVPAVVQDFLFGPWSMVLAHARLTHGPGSVDPGGYVAVISDLLWSVKPEAALREPARAFELIPRVLMKLREGLDLLGHPPGETETFFRALERLHRPVLKLRAKHRRQAMESLAPESPLDLLDEDLLLPAAAQKPHAAEELWLAPGELQACGFEDTLPSDYADLGPSESAAPARAEAAPAPPLPDAEAEAIVAGLREGSWVDLFSKQQWRRARLVWAGTKGTLFMFVSHGNRPHSMTRRSLHRLVVSRLLRPIEGHEVVQHAIETLASRPEPQPLAA